jgi:hypothetical protein
MRNWITGLLTVHQRIVDPRLNFELSCDWLKTGHVVWLLVYDLTIPPPILYSSSIVWRTVVNVLIDILNRQTWNRSVAATFSWARVYNIWWHGRPGHSYSLHLIAFRTVYQFSIDGNIWPYELRSYFTQKSLRLYMCLVTTWHAVKRTINFKSYSIYELFSK